MGLKKILCARGRGAPVGGGIGGWPPIKKWGKKNYNKKILCARCRRGGSSGGGYRRGPLYKNGGKKKRNKKNNKKYSMQEVMRGV